MEQPGARRVAALVSEPDPRLALAALNRVLFEEMNLRGNREDYYDPRNSFLNDVLDRGLGIPITLAIVYMEVAKRVGFTLAGVGMPGHFLLKHYGLDGEILIDCFNRGDVISRQDCQNRLNEIYSGEMKMRPEFLHPISRRQILTRMLNNLKTVYLSTRNFRKALVISDLILVIYPRSAEDVKQRALWCALQHGITPARGRGPGSIFEAVAECVGCRGNSPDGALHSPLARADELSTGYRVLLLRFVLPAFRWSERQTGGPAHHLALLV